MRVWVLQRPWLARVALAAVLLLVLWPVWRLGAARWSGTRAGGALEALRGRRVVIDPGHGGDDPGAVGPGNLLEKRLVLEISLRLKEQLAAAGAEAVLTRETDTHLPPGDERFARNRDLQYRVDVTNRADADVMVSIHANKFSGSQWSGAQVFYDQRGVPGCRELAIAITRTLQRDTGTKRWIQSGQFYITHYAKIPAVLVEVGFLSNPQEAELLQTPSYQDKVARSIIEGIAGFLAKPAPNAGSQPPAG